MENMMYFKVVEKLAEVWYEVVGLVSKYWSG